MAPSGKIVDDNAEKHSTPVSLPLLPCALPHIYLILKEHVAIEYDSNNWPYI
jgi:hypothetical protein